MAQDVDSGRRQTSRHQIPAETGVERAACDSVRPGACLPERLARCHRCQLLAGVSEAGAVPPETEIGTLTVALPGPVIAKPLPPMVALSVSVLWAI